MENKVLLKKDFYVNKEKYAAYFVIKNKNIIFQIEANNKTFDLVLFEKENFKMSNAKKLINEMIDIHVELIKNYSGLSIDERSFLKRLFYRSATY